MSNTMRDLVKWHSDATGPAKAVLLEIADHCNTADGSGTWPGEERLAVATGFALKTVQRAIRKVLEYDRRRLGEPGRVSELEVKRGEWYDQQGRRHTSNRYRILVEVLEAKPGKDERLGALREQRQAVINRSRQRAREQVGTPVTPPRDTGDATPAVDPQAAAETVQERVTSGDGKPVDNVRATLRETSERRYRERQSDVAENVGATLEPPGVTPKVNPQDEPPATASGLSARSARSKTLVGPAARASRSDGHADNTIPASPAPNPTTPTVEPASPSKASLDGEQGTGADGPPPADQRQDAPRLSATLKAPTLNGHATRRHRLLPPEQPPTADLTPEEFARRQAIQDASRAALQAGPAEPAAPAAGVAPTTKRGTP